MSELPQEAVEVLKEQYKKLLDDKIVDITFKKKDGTLRTIRATRAANLQPEYNKKTTRKRVRPPHLLSVVDTEINEWRTVNLQTISEVEVVKAL